MPSATLGRGLLPKHTYYVASADSDGEVVEVFFGVGRVARAIRGEQVDLTLGGRGALGGVALNGEVRTVGSACAAGVEGDPGCTGRVSPSMALVADAIGGCAARPGEGCRGL